MLDGDDFYIDLLLFHRRMRPLVVIELKIDDFKPAYSGQWSCTYRDRSKSSSSNADECATTPRKIGRQIAWQNVATTPPNGPDQPIRLRTKGARNPSRRLQGHVTHMSFVSSRQGSSPPARTNETRCRLDEVLGSEARSEVAGGYEPSARAANGC